MSHVAKGAQSDPTDLYAEPRWRIVWNVVAIVSVVLAIATLYFFFSAQGSLPVAKKEPPVADTPAIARLKLQCLIIYAFWALVPPVGFFIEYCYFLWHAGEKTRAKYEKLQEHARAIWAALLVVLGIIYASKFGLKLD